MRHKVTQTLKDTSGEVVNIIKCFAENLQNAAMLILSDPTKQAFFITSVRAYYDGSRFQLRQTGIGSSTTHTERLPIDSCDAPRSNPSWRCIPLITTMPFTQRVHPCAAESLYHCFILGTVSNLLFIEATASNIFVKTRDYRRIESGYLAEQIPRQDKTRGKYTVIPSTPLERPRYHP